MRKPKGYSPAFTARVNQILINEKIEIPGEYTVYGVHGAKGYCYYDRKYITVPVWTAEKGDDYILYYSCHEIAHAYTDHDRSINHGPEFMEWFMLICPEHLWHHELDYKPRLAAAAGINKPS